MDSPASNSAPKLSGIIVPMVTPLVDDETLDVAGLERLVEHLADGGVNGIFVLGTTGEGPNLSRRVRKELIDRTCGLVDRRLPILVGITETVWSESQRLAEAAAGAGATAVVMAPPYYFPLSQMELLRYVEDACGKLPLPLVLYNIPQMTKTAFDVATVRQLMELESIWGIKDSSGNLQYLRTLLDISPRRGNWTVLVGNELLLSEGLAAGAHGGIPGGANLVPRLFAELYRASRSGDRVKVGQCHDSIARLNRLYAVDDSSAAVLQVAKTGLSLMGVCNDYVATPFARYRAQQREELRRLLGETLALCDRPGR